MMKNNQRPETLSPTSRQLTYLVAVLFTILGLPLFLAPAWAAENFLFTLVALFANRSSQQRQIAPVGIPKGK